MVRKYVPEKKNRAFSITYWLGVLVIIVLWVWAFKLYFDRYEYLHPDITWATPGIDTQLVRVRGFLLWKENVIRAPVSGVCVFPLGKGPVRVPRGAVVARVGGREVKAYQQGYFVAGKDGRENGWRYSTLWHAKRSEFTKESKLRYFGDGAQVARGQMIGKIAEQPQELRFVGYLPSRGDIAKQLKSEKLRVRMDAEDTISDAEVRVTRKDGKLTKFALAMPWFPPEMLMSRSYELIVDAGQTRGAMIPQSALLEKGGKKGVYMIRGARVVFAPVSGKTLNGGMFLVTKGISVGDAVVEDAASAREGRIQLW